MTRKTVSFKTLSGGAKAESWVERQTDSVLAAPQATRSPVAAVGEVELALPARSYVPDQRGQLTALSPFSRMVSIVESNAILMSGIQELSRQWFGIIRQRAQQSLDQLDSAADCRSPAELLAVQGSFVCDSLEHLLEDSAYLAQFTAQVTLDAAHAVSTRRANYFQEP